MKTATHHQGNPTQLSTHQGEVITDRFVPNVLTEYDQRAWDELSDDAKRHVFKSACIHKLPIEDIIEAGKVLDDLKAKGGSMVGASKHVASILMFGTRCQHLTIWIAGPTR